MLWYKCQQRLCRDSEDIKETYLLSRRDCACVCVTEMAVGESKENVPLLGVSKENVYLLSSNTCVT